jgi:mannose-6-phosphate isomerase-like protein (cupin superfamily)
MQWRSHYALRNGGNMNAELATAKSWRGDELEVRSSPSATDVLTFVQALSDSDLSTTEHFEKDLYLEGIISKPWGHEYRVYADILYDVWKLSIAPGECTSTHCHPRKETALLCLAGEGRVQRLGREYDISEGDVVMLRKGVFHATENVGASPLELVEVETPRNKLDLVRVRDRYGRAGTRYETKTVEGPIATLECLTSSSAAKLRTLSLHHAYEFCVVDSSAAVAECEERLVFAVSLSLVQAFSHEIKVVAQSDARRLSEESGGPYLLILRGDAR